MLAFPEEAADNLSLRVTEVRQETTEAGHDLVLSLNITRNDATAATKSIPIQVEVNGARSEVAAELSGSGLDIKNHRVPIDQQRRGWGKISIPADTNLADNEFYFVFDEPPPRRTVIITERP